MGDVGRWSILLCRWGWSVKIDGGFSGFWGGKFHDKLLKGRTSDRFGAFVASLTILKMPCLWGS